jgi:hypothetical protein
MRFIDQAMVEQEEGGQSKAGQGKENRSLSSLRSLPTPDTLPFASELHPLLSPGPELKLKRFGHTVMSGRL